MNAKLYNLLIENYRNFKEESLYGLRIKHKDLETFLLKAAQNPNITVEKIGQSVEDRGIYRIKAGKGKRKIFYFSQMHGNESTGTRVLCDMLNFLLQTQNFQSEIQSIFENCTICIVPMLNPDGAEVFSRFNAFGTDINRDATALQTVEGNILLKALTEFEPNYAYSLHDQPAHYAVKHTLKPVAFSFLASAYDEKKSINTSRANAMAHISNLNIMLKVHLSGYIAKYSDDYMPTAFGDFIQKQGISSILVESGWIAGDPQKETLRMHHFGFLAADLFAHSKEAIQPQIINHYNGISFMKKDHFFEYIIRNTLLEKFGKQQNADIAIERKIEEKSDQFVVCGIGDFSQKSGFYETELDGEKLKIPVKINQDATELINLYFSEKKTDSSTK